MPPRMWRALVLFTGWILGLLALPASAQVTGLNYTVSGIGSRVFWADKAGLDNGYLYGAEVGLGFGEALELSGLYLRGTDFATDFSAFTDDEALQTGLAGLPERTVDLRRIGTRLRLNVGSFRFNLGQGKVVPFLSAGTGLLRFAPGDLDRSEVIYVDGGVGFAVALADRYTLTLAAENMAYRYSPGTTFFSADDLAALGLTPARFEDQTVYNPAATASLKIYLGGREPGEMTELDQALRQQFSSRRFRLSVEPFYGQIDFNDALDFPESQALVGVGAGIDLGAFVGLRAFYWRATNEESMLEDGLPDDTYDLQLYGGEMNLGFGREWGRGITPSLLLGAGYADVGEKYAEQTGTRPESRYFALGGLGVHLPLSSSLTLHGSVRSLFMSTENVEDVSEPGNVFGSLMYSAGVTFHIGSGGGSAAEGVGTAIASTEAGSRERDAALERELARLQARLDSLESAPRMPAAEPAQTAAARTPAMPLLRADTLVVDGDTTVVMREMPTAEPAAVRSNISDRTITVPVPEQGEIYIRFGEPEAAPRVETVYAPPTIITLGGDSSGVGGLSPDQVRAIIREEMQALAPQGDVETLTPEEFAANLQALETRLERRLAEESNTLRDEMDRQNRPALPPQDERITVEEEATPRGGLLAGFGTRELDAVLPYVGVRVSEGPSQMLIGVRANYRFSNTRLRFAPELGLGFGDGTSINALTNLLLPLTPSRTLNPYVGAGVGLLSDSGVSGLDLVLSVLAGAEYTLSNGRTFYGEFSTFDFLDFSRVIVGYRIRF